jgi:hypothetical protein
MGGYILTVGQLVSAKPLGEDGLVGSGLGGDPTGDLLVDHILDVTRGQLAAVEWGLGRVVVMPTPEKVSPIGIIEKNRPFTASKVEEASTMMADLEG